MIQRVLKGNKGYSESSCSSNTILAITAGIGVADENKIEAVSN